MSGENLGERIDLQGPADELKELADTFDGMLGRLDAAFASQRHFVANASHELRTPLAIMRTEIDVSMADPDASAEDLREMGDAVREAIDRCERLISSLLFLARSEAVPGGEMPVDLASLTGDCLTDIQGQQDRDHARRGRPAGRQPGSDRQWPERPPAGRHHRDAAVPGDVQLEQLEHGDARWPSAR